MKLIAKTQKGTEYFHSRKEAYFAPDSSAEKICAIMNDVKYNLKSNDEVWHVYDYDFSQEMYVTRRLRIRKGVVSLCTI